LTLALATVFIAGVRVENAWALFALALAACGGRQSMGGAPREDAGSDARVDTPGLDGAGTQPETGMQPVCGGQNFGTDPAPTDLYIMFGQSSSMGDPVPSSIPPATWWQVAQQAVTNFVNDPRAAGSVPGSPAMTVGIQYFPLDGVAPQSCMAGYQTPDVELGLLPKNIAAIATSIQGHQPTGSRPTAAALSGAIAHMKTWASNHAGHAPAVVLVTDGFPTECDPQDITDIAQSVKAAFDGEPRVRTFVVGFNLGAGGANLNELAIAGGTSKAFLIDGGDIGAQFVDAMLGISGPQPSCQFDLPQLPAGMQLDISRVAVTYTPNSTMVEAQIPKLNGLGDCALNMNQGWYYDSPSAPTKITVCPGTCSSLGAGVVKTVTGCTTLPGMTR
jgi:hypothetical protein